MEELIYIYIGEEMLFLSLTLRNHTKFVGIKYHTPEFRNCNNDLNLSNKAWLHIRICREFLSAGGMRKRWDAN